MYYKLSIGFDKTGSLAATGRGTFWCGVFYEIAANADKDETLASLVWQNHNVERCCGQSASSALEHTRPSSEELYTPF